MKRIVSLVALPATPLVLLVVMLSVLTTVVAQCPLKQCLHGGRCIGTCPGCSCDCTFAKGWTGAYCEVPMCSPQCANGGTCFAPGECDCSTADPAAGWNGSTCSTPICTIPCRYGGTCVNPFTCDCSKTGWEGPMVGCTVPVCDSACLHGGICIGPNKCDCDPATPPGGWKGDQCEVAICTEKCLNGGVCDRPETCNCTGYSGTHCEFDINECSGAVSPCDPLTTCSNSLGSFSCSPCPPPYGGDGKTGCLDPCKAGGCDPLVTCDFTPGSPTFQCGRCPKGYQGDGREGCWKPGATTARVPSRFTSVGQRTNAPQPASVSNSAPAAAIVPAGTCLAIAGLFAAVLPRRLSQ